MRPLVLLAVALFVTTACGTPADSEVVVSDTSLTAFDRQADDTPGTGAERPNSTAVPAATSSIPNPVETTVAPVAWFDPLPELARRMLHSSDVPDWYPMRPLELPNGGTGDWQISGCQAADVIAEFVELADYENELRVAEDAGGMQWIAEVSTDDVAIDLTSKLALAAECASTETLSFSGGSVDLAGASGASRLTYDVSGDDTGSFVTDFVASSSGSVVSVLFVRSSTDSAPLPSSVLDLAQVAADKIAAPDVGVEVGVLRPDGWPNAAYAGRAIVSIEGADGVVTDVPMNGPITVVMLPSDGAYRFSAAVEDAGCFDTAGVTDGRNPAIDVANGDVVQLRDTGEICE